MNPTEPLVSIITPSFNQGRYIEQTIRSVVEQDYPHIEYIVIDGGSTDGSVEIIRLYSQHFSYWVSEPDRGQSHAINKGIARANGEIIAWLNSDDFYLPGAISTVVSAFREHPNAAIISGECEIVDAEGFPTGRILRPDVTLSSLLFENRIPQPATFVRRDALGRSYLVDETLRYVMDFELWLHMLTRGPGVTVEVPLAAFRVWEGSKTSTDGLDFLTEKRQVIERWLQRPDVKEIYGDLTSRVRTGLDWLWALGLWYEGSYLESWHAFAKIYRDPLVKSMAPHSLFSTLTMCLRWWRLTLAVETIQRCGFGDPVWASTPVGFRAERDRQLLLRRRLARSTQVKVWVRLLLERPTLAFKVLSELTLLNGTRRKQPS